MIKVLICSPPLTSVGGIATWARNLFTYSAFVDNKNIHLELLPMERKNFIDPSTPSWRRIKYGIEDYWTVLKKYKKALKQKSPHIAHIATSASFGLFRDILMQRIARKYNIKNIVHFHFGRIPELKKKKNWEWRLLNYAIRHADIVIVIDMKSYKTLAEAGHGNIQLMPNPLSQELFSAINALKDEKRIDRKIIFVGNLIPTKGIFELVKACINIPGIYLKMLGHLQPGIDTRLLELAKEKGNTKWIEITGEESHEIIIKEMLSSHVFVLPTYTEGFPNVVLEGMACGCSIIASAVGAIPEMLNADSNEVAGLCIQPKNVDILRKAITRMLDDKTFAQKCGKNARRRASEKYSMPVVWEEVKSVWEKIQNEPVVS